MFLSVLFDKMRPTSADASLCIDYPIIVVLYSCISQNILSKYMVNVDFMAWASVVDV